MHDILRPEPEAEILPLTHAMESQVRMVQDDARRILGEHLSVADALKVIDAMGQPCQFKLVPPDPEPTNEPYRFRRDICFAEIKLQELGYDDETIALILGDIQRTGTAWCSEHFDDSSSYEHAECIEAILDRHTDWDSPRWDAIRVGATV